jgi:nucleotide-binding universal stress UspA family protein
MKAILIATDFSDLALHALTTGVSIAEETGCKIILMHNVPTLFTRWEGMMEKEREQYPEVLIKTTEAEKKLNKLLHSGKLNHLDVEKVLTHGITTEQVLLKAREFHADLIVMGAHGNSKEKSFIGSNLQRIIRNTKTPVLAVKREVPSNKLKKLLVPASFDADITEPFDLIKEIALKFNSIIQLLFVNTPGNFKDASTIQNQIEAFTARYPDVRFELATTDHETIEDGILDFIEREKPDYISMITYDHRRDAEYMLSVTDTVIYHCDVPVLAIHLDHVQGEKLEAHNTAYKL